METPKWFLHFEKAFKLIRQITTTALISIGLGFISQLIQGWLDSYYFNEFLRNNLINLLIALLAINTTTMGIVLTKIRDLIDKSGHSELFKNTRTQMLLSIKEQISLVVLGIVLLTISNSYKVVLISNFELFINSLISAVFVYSMMVLYDTANAVLIIIDYNQDN